jgi:hypothetical protein
MVERIDYPFSSPMHFRLLAEISSELSSRHTENVERMSEQDNLVKRLRGPQSAEVDYATRQEGADRIEALEAKIKDLEDSLGRYEAEHYNRQIGG